MVMKADGEEGNEDLALSSNSKTKIPQPDHWSIPTTVKIIIINRHSTSGANLNAAGPGPAQRTIFFLK